VPVFDIKAEAYGNTVDLPFVAIQQLNPGLLVAVDTSGDEGMIGLAGCCQSIHTDSGSP